MYIRIRHHNIHHLIKEGLSVKQNNLKSVTKSSKKEKEISGLDVQTNLP